MFGSLAMDLVLVLRQPNLGNICCPLGALKIFYVLAQLTRLSSLDNDILLNSTFQILLMRFHPH